MASCLFTQDFFC